MKNLQGIISKSINNANIQFERLGAFATSAANYNTNGYKAIRFENYLQEDGTIAEKQRTDFKQGSLLKTSRDLDIAIEGQGLIPVTTDEGKTAYTRAGSFKINNEGLLITEDGSIVSDGIKIPIDTQKIVFKPNGKVTVFDKTNKETQVGEIPLVTFNNLEGLEVGDGNKLYETKDSGKPVLLTDHQNIRQGFTERSNVNLMTTVTDIMRLNASLIASTRIIKFTDEIYRQSVNLKQ